MATTLPILQILAVGVRDSTGAAVASGKARFYQPGTLTAETVYSDDAGATPISIPLTLDAGGRGTVYMLNPVRVIVKDSTDTTTMLDTVIVQRHDQQYITHTAFNGGAETTLESVLSTANTSFGSGFQLLESTGATARNVTDWIGQFMVSVKDFGALGDDVQDDTTEIQAAIDRVEARGGGIVFFPYGTYRISATLTIDAAGVCLVGVGRGKSVIKNYSTTGNAITVNLGSAVDAKLFIRDIGITASTTSSGTGIILTNGDRVEIERVSVALHRTGIASTAVTAAQLTRILIESTDDNASAIGVSLGARCRIDHSEIISGTDNGTGISASGADSRVSDCYINNFATGLTLGGAVAIGSRLHIFSATTGITASGADAMIDGAYVSTSTTGVSLTGARAICENAIVGTVTTGVSLGAAGTTAKKCVVTTATTGFSVGAFADCALENNTSTANTTDLSVNASATLLREVNNNFTTITNTAGTPRVVGRLDGITTTTSSSTTPSWTPVLANQGRQIQVFECTSATQATVTVNAPTLTNAQPGEILHLVFHKNAAWNGHILFSFNSVYRQPMGTGTIAGVGGYTLTTGTVETIYRMDFRYDGTNLICIHASSDRIA